MDTPVPDLRVRTVVPDYAGMHALVADLVLPEGAPMAVMSVLETSRELIRHSYYRYEFATAAVTHALSAAEQVLAGRLAATEDTPLRELLGRAAATGLLPAFLAGELERALVLRERLARGAATSAAVNPLRAVDLLRAVFETVALVLGPPPARPGPAGPRERLALLWEEHREAPFPASFRGVDVDGADLIVLDADVAGLVQRELDGGLDGSGVAALWGCIAGLETVVPRLGEEYCAAYFARLRTIADLVAARHLPGAT
ncbi:hypothetical protein ACFQ6N_35040 [Kitasatospora sp. NPDC056446]|uniref:hypothetical protein n=1 Tax=Kitasatospora sp. NPDC056446 TaxID=3345819 RepID=UPI0036C8A081